MKIYNKVFERIVSLDNLFSAWNSFRSDKGNKPDVLRFEWQLEPNIFQLHRDLRAKRYCHGSYTSFFIHDPKQRHIHKATVRDRIVHHAVYNILTPIFEPTFIAHSFSCRENKGTHKGVAAVEAMIRSVSRNGTCPCFALKSDIQRFFFRIDHALLLTILERRLQDEDVMWLLREIIGSFSIDDTGSLERKGLPIGNLTSQLFANVYLNEFDQFMKHVLLVKHYVRYTDDFLVIASDPDYLNGLLPSIRLFLHQRLALQLHPLKTTIRKTSQGVDFLGYVIFPHHQLVRTKTRQRMFRKLERKVEQYRSGAIDETKLQQSLQSYRGVLSHANTHRLQEQMENQVWFWIHD